MQENRDPAITLFGKKIHLPSDGDDPPSTAPPPVLREKNDDQTVKKPVEEGSTETLHRDESSPPTSEEATNLEHSPEDHVNPNSQDESSDDQKPSENEKPSSQDKPLKKPDKILPCPRCNSMDTKFCYYNNYNVNQPRHFCKACQRYWTAGGTMRNVPVGAGRRKNKNSAAQYRNITISEALQAAQIDAQNGVIYPGLKTNGRYLNFGLEAPAPICESMASLLSLGDKNGFNGTVNGFHKFEVKEVPLPVKGGETGDDCSSGSSVTVSSSGEGEGRTRQQPFMRNANGYPAQAPCLTGIPWPYQWNSTVQSPVFCPPGIPVPVFAGPYWNCSVPTPWNLSWISPESQVNQKSPSSGPNSPLGKHSREGAMLRPDGSSEEEQQSKQKAPNGCVLVPKTLRIDDPDEAAKSSIWGTLGIKNESIANGGIFKGFRSKSNEKKHIAKPSPVLRANPATLSRSLNFQESV